MGSPGATASAPGIRSITLCSPTRASIWLSAPRYSTATGLPARVVAVEYLGADSQIEARVGEQSVILRMPGALAVAPGEPIRLAWEAADAHWFDASSQCRIA